MSDLTIEELAQAIRSKIENPIFATLAGDHLRGFAGSASPYVVSGAMVLPLRQVLGLRPVRETKKRQVFVEGRDVTLSFHDVRHFLDQIARTANTAVLEQLHSPLLIFGDDDFQRLVQASRGFVNKHCYHDFLALARGERQALGVDGAVPTRHLLEASRLYLAGMHLLATGALESNLEALMAEFDALWLKPFLVRYRSHGHASLLEPDEARLLGYELDRLEKGLEAAHDSSSLPDAGGSISSLDEFLVELRLRQAGETPG